MDNFLSGALSFVSGAIIWEVVKLIYPDLKRPIASRINAKKTFYENLDPILKSASELYGKLESLAKEDFATFINPDNSNSDNPEHNRKYVLYLFAQFWAQLEHLRLESQYTALSRMKKGKNLLRFIETIESRKYRLLDRSVQRIIGECLISLPHQKFRVMTLKEFLEQLENQDSVLNEWASVLKIKLLAISDKEQRQRVLRFGIIVAALIDHFDPKHKTVRRREIYVNKLSIKSRKMIKTSLMEHYLAFLRDKEKYYK